MAVRLKKNKTKGRPLAWPTGQRYVKEGSEQVLLPGAFSRNSSSVEKLKSEHCNHCHGGDISVGNFRSS